MAFNKKAAPQPFWSVANPLAFARIVHKNRSLLAELIKREFSARYQGSFGGILWSFVQPLFLLSVYTLAFGVILKTRWGFSGSTIDYAFVLFAGLIAFNLFSECLTRSPTLIISNPNFVKKVVFPLELLPLVTVSAALGHALIATAVWVGGYFLVVGVPHPTILFAPLILLALCPFLLALAWLLSSLGVLVRDIIQITGMVSHTLLFLTPIFYSRDIAPELVQRLMALNPLTFIVEQMRAVLFEGRLPDFGGIALYVLAANLIAWFAYAFFRKLRPLFADLV